MRRWSDNDKHFGSWLTHGKSSYSKLSLMLCSGTELDDPGCNLRICVGQRYWIIELPQIIKALGRARTYEEGPREYGFTYSEQYLHVYYGPQTHSSTTTKSWCGELPWLAHRFVKERVFDVDGNVAFETSSASSMDRYAIIEGMKKLVFKVRDYDGTPISATAHGVERTWKRGEGWFKWLSFFTKPLVRQTLEVEFGSEVGKDKGSWKGGLLGASMTMQKGETLQDAVRRFCDQDFTSKCGSFKITLNYGEPNHDACAHN